MWAVFEWEPKPRTWKLWHVAPTKQAAEEVAAALRKFVRVHFAISGPGFKAPAGALRIVAEKGPTKSPVTWGWSAGEFRAWQVRDALADGLYAARAAGRRVQVDPQSVRYVDVRGQPQYTARMDPQSFIY